MLCCSITYPLGLSALPPRSHKADQPTCTREDRRRGSPEVQGICKRGVVQKVRRGYPREAIGSHCRMILSLVLSDHIGLGSLRDF